MIKNCDIKFALGGKSAFSFNLSAARKQKLTFACGLYEGFVT
jgi:hypothetical protein